MKDIKKIVDEVNGTMAMEGMPITADDRSRICLCLRDKKMFDKTLNDLIHKHSVPNSVEELES